MSWGGDSAKSSWAACMIEVYEVKMLHVYSKIRFEPKSPGDSNHKVQMVMMAVRVVRVLRGGAWSEWITGDGRSGKLAMTQGAGCAKGDGVLLAMRSAGRASGQLERQ